MAGAGLCLLAPGCVKPLFPDDEPRTQFDRYDRVRGDLPEARVTDQYGRPRENVRARLLRKGY
jgi:hypothetical protein